jgi:protein SCO1/2
MKAELVYNRAAASLRRFVWPALAILLLTAGPAVRGQVVQEHPKDLSKVDIVEHLGKKIPLDLTFTDETGKQVKLGDYFHPGTPVILNLVYFECPMLCSMELNGVTDVIKQLPWTPGDQYRLVTVSFNPRETYQLAAAKKANYLKQLGKPGADAGWAFLVGAEDQSKALADAIGFKYFWDPKLKQYAHATATYVLTGDGTISRYLYGIQYKDNDVRLALLEASKGKIGSTVDRIILYCYHYDPSAKGYVLFAANLMRIGGAITLVLITIFLALLWFYEHRKHRHHGRTAARTS